MCWESNVLLFLSKTLASRFLPTRILCLPIPSWVESLSCGYGSKNIHSPCLKPAPCELKCWFAICRHVSVSHCTHHIISNFFNQHGQIWIRKRLTILHVNVWFKKLAPSSILNNTPPKGAPNAAATPAAAPALTKSRFSLQISENLCDFILYLIFAQTYLHFLFTSPPTPPLTSITAMAVDFSLHLSLHPTPNLDYYYSRWFFGQVRQRNSSIRHIRKNVQSNFCDSAPPKAITSLCTDEKSMHLKTNNFISLFVFHKLLR